MDAVKVDNTRRVRLTMLAPGDYYVPEHIGTGDVLLHRVPPPRRHKSRAEVAAALDSMATRHATGWDELKKEIR